MTTLAAASDRGRVLVGQVLIALALFATNASMISILLPSRFAELDPAGKVGALAAALSLAFVITAVAQPIVGALSDRTHTSLGRRLPWMAAGAVIGGFAIGLIGSAPSVLVLALLWAIGQPALSAVQVTTDAYLIDVFPLRRRGLAAGVVGIAVVAGSAAGAVLAGSLARAPVAFWVLAGAVILAVALFAALVRDRPLPPSERSRWRPAAALRTAAAAVAAHPDYLRVLVWRIGYSIAYGSVFAYLLYILTDLIGVPKAQAGHLIGLATVLGGAGALVSVFVGGWLSDRVGRRRIFVLIGSGAIVAGDLALLIRPTVPAALVTAALFGIGLGLSISCGRALASQVLPDPIGGAAAGLGGLNTAANIGQAVAPTIGALAIGFAGYPGALVTSIAGAMVCAVAIAVVKSVR